MQIEGNFAKMVAPIQYLVYCKTANKCLINWKIYSVNPSIYSYTLEFYKQESSVLHRSRGTKLFIYYYIMHVHLFTLYSS